MKKEIIRRIFAIIAIFTMLVTDLAPLGTGLISYAADLNKSTNNTNIEFSAYFKNEEGERISEITTNVQELKMYAEITVKNEGYFNGALELTEGNFNFKNQIQSDGIGKIEGNKITLNQINAGNTVEIEIGIIPINSDTIQESQLKMESKIKLAGTYMETSYKGKDIEAEKTVNLKLSARENTDIEQNSEVVTNKIYNVNGANKRIVQIAVKSRITDNNYPVKTSTIKAIIPEKNKQNLEQVKIVQFNSKATNGNETVNTQEWDKTATEVQMKTENTGESISWKKGVYDEYIITYIFKEETNIAGTDLQITEETEIYNKEDKITKDIINNIGTEEIGKTIVTEIKDNQGEIYKGQLYANSRTDDKRTINYNTTTKITIREKNIIDSVKVKEEKDAYTTAETGDLELNETYKYTRINKEKMIELLGESGTIQIKYGDYNVNTISAEDEADENGELIAKYDEQVGEIEIVTSRPVKEGTLEIKHEKEILPSNYTEEQIKPITGIKTKNTITGLIRNQEVITNTTEQTKELKETQSKTELTVNKVNLSTMSENKDVALGVKFITNGTQYDLFKNPIVVIQLPEQVKDVTLKGVDKVCGDEFTITRKEYDKTHKSIEIELDGEQTAYAENDATQLYLQVNLDITLEQTAASKTEKIIMSYKNENAIQYAKNGVTEKAINIAAPSGIITINNLNTYNINSVAGISQDKQTANIDKNTAGGTNAEYQISVVNNTGSNINNVKILGYFPTKGEIQTQNETITNTLETSVAQAIQAGNARVYYSESSKATADLENTSNGWTQDTSAIANAKVYLIDLGTMNVGTSFTTGYTSKISTNIDYNLSSYAGYKVLYNDEQNSQTQTVESTLVGMETENRITETDLKIETNIEATVGNDVLKNGDTVKAGEIIKYKVTAKNTGDKDLKNVTIKGLVPEGTVVTEFITPQGADTDFEEPEWPIYWKEKKELKEVSKTVDLEQGQEYSIEYEVRVNMDITNGTEISNRAVITCGGLTLNGNEIKNILQESKIRISLVEMNTEKKPVQPNTLRDYFLIVENTSNEPIKNLKLKMQNSGEELVKILDNNLNYILQEDGYANIEEIPANDMVVLEIMATVSQSDLQQVESVALITDSNENTYRSNKLISKLEQAKVELSLTSPTAGQYVNIGDYIIYNITVENPTNCVEDVEISNQLSEYLVVEEVYINGELTIQSINPEDTETYLQDILNETTYTLIIEENQKSEISIKARVNEITEDFDKITITNTAQATVKGEVKTTSEEITHTIVRQASESEEKIISGVAWLDENQDGQKDTNEKLLQDITVRLLDTETNQLAIDKEGNVLETTTGEDGTYKFSKVQEGIYIVVFDYDTTKYEPTIYMKDGVSTGLNSKALAKVFNGKVKGNAGTDIIYLTENLYDINLGLKQNLKFDLELGKYINTIVVQNSKGAKTYECKDNETLKKIEINSKQIEGSVVVLEYKIKVKNTGEIAGYVTNIRDYLPNGLTFSSELNPNWYLSGKDLYTKSLANTRIEPGEEKEISLILTKTITSDNVGLINNRAEIAESYNELGKQDIDSTANNQSSEEDDMGAADVIIGISTGMKTAISTILITLNICLIGFAIYLISRKSSEIN